MSTSIIKLAEIFQEYKIYPKNKYTSNSPVYHFLEKFPENYFSHDLKEFLEHQNYNSPDVRGADLPWWGEKYFSSENGIRVMIISQDSLAKDAKSIVFYANMLPYSDEDFKSWEVKFREKGSFYNSWKKLKILLASWEIDFNFVYMTDARKVYKPDKVKFDNKRCKELIFKEINLRIPNLIICFGIQGLNLLTCNYKKYKLNDIVNLQTDNRIIINNMLCYVSYFPTGNGLKNFNKYESIITRVIRKYLKTIAV